jgi:hypothetical protein
MNHYWSETVNEQKQVEKLRDRVGSPNRIPQIGAKDPAKSEEKKSSLFLLSVLV